ncbi:hypothetical protein Bbelb_263100 [Branchiostoma belcheri]|nr:hypothetical protein Bbelb_263100 [Branchiostoma belcheri]
MSKRRGRCNRRSRRRAKMTFPVEPGQEELWGGSWRMWAAVAGRSREIEGDGDWSSNELTPEDVHYAHTPQDVGDGVPDMDDNQHAPGVSTALPDGDLDGDDDLEKKYSEKHLNSGDEKRPTSAMTSGYNSSTGMSARDDSSLLEGNDDPVRDEEEGTTAVDPMDLKNSSLKSSTNLNSARVLAENPQNHDTNNPVRRPVKNADRMTVMVMVVTARHCDSQAAAIFVTFDLTGGPSIIKGEGCATCRDLMAQLVIWHICCQKRYGPFLQWTFF